MRITTYLSFKGQCEEAFRFYARCFGGLEVVDRFGVPWLIKCEGSDGADRS